MIIHMSCFYWNVTKGTYRLYITKQYERQEYRHKENKELRSKTETLTLVFGMSNAPCNCLTWSIKHQNEFTYQTFPHTKGGSVCGRRLALTPHILSSEPKAWHVSAARACIPPLLTSIIIEHGSDQTIEERNTENQFMYFMYCYHSNTVNTICIVIH